MANKTIVITGASAGIGAGLAVRLAEDGHSLVLAARRRPELQRVAHDAMKRGSPRAIVVEADVTKRADVERIREVAIEALGGFDVWVNNAGRGITRSVLDLTDADIDDMIALNVKSALYGMQVAVAHFMDRGHGQVINIASFLGRVPLAPHRSAYNAAKAAVIALSANLRQDLRARYRDIHVSVVMPGMVATEFGRNAIGSPPNTPIYSGPHVQSVEAVADMIAQTIDNPVAEVYTNPASADMARRYLADVEAFETQGDNPWRPRAPETRA
jgi:Short-chain dehydrogenases of various substrate specificities